MGTETDPRIVPISSMFGFNFKNPVIDLQFNLYIVHCMYNYSKKTSELDAIVTREQKTADGNKRLLTDYD